MEESRAIGTGRSAHPDAAKQSLQGSFMVVNSSTQCDRQQREVGATGRRGLQQEVPTCLT